MVSARRFGIRQHAPAGCPDRPPRNRDRPVAAPAECRPSPLTRTRWPGSRRTSVAQPKRTSTSDVFRQAARAAGIDGRVAPLTVTPRPGLGVADIQSPTSSRACTAGAEGRHRRRDGRTRTPRRPRGVPRPLRPVRLHHGQRDCFKKINQNGCPSPFAGRRLRLGRGDQPRHGTWFRRLPDMPHPARRGHLGHDRRPRRGGEPSRGDRRVVASRTAYGTTEDSTVTVTTHFYNHRHRRDGKYR